MPYICEECEQVTPDRFAKQHDTGFGVGWFCVWCLADRVEEDPLRSRCCGIAIPWVPPGSPKRLECCCRYKEEFVKAENDYDEMCADAELEGLR